MINRHFGRRVGFSAGRSGDAKELKIPVKADPDMKQPAFPEKRGLTGARRQPDLNRRNNGFANRRLRPLGYAAEGSAI